MISVAFVKLIIVRHIIGSEQLRWRKAGRLAWPSKIVF